MQNSKKNLELIVTNGHDAHTYNVFVKTGSGHIPLTKG